MADLTADLTVGSLARFIEHTLLNPEARVADVERLCQETLAFGLRGACVNSRYVAVVAAHLRGSGSSAVSVVGFPFGAGLTSAKAKEAGLAVDAGADEIDMVIALGAAKQGDWADVAADVRAVVGAAGGKPVKAIIETGLLSAAEIVAACAACVDGGAAFVKTSTGFLGRGASVEDVELMRRSLPTTVQIKASGGIKTFAQAARLVEAGATRIGSSSGPFLAGGLAGGPDSGDRPNY